MSHLADEHLSQFKLNFLARLSHRIHVLFVSLCILYVAHRTPAHEMNGKSAESDDEINEKQNILLRIYFR